MAGVHFFRSKLRLGSSIATFKAKVAHIGGNVVDWSRLRPMTNQNRNSIGRLPPILINTMPKSGSIYLTRTIAASLGIDFSLESLADGSFPSYVMIPRALENLRRGDVVRHEHFDASPINLAICARHIDRVVLHLRDPRQATLSWTHHFNRLLLLHPHSTYPTVNQPLQDYRRWPFERQLDWQIDYHMVSLVAWLRTWIAIANNPPFKILRTQFEELINDERALFDRILEFYGLPANGVEMRTPKKTIEYHYRCGRADEWKHVFSAEQKARSRAIVEDDILDHFGWSAD
jgi:Sulfotransferase domain